MFLEEKSTYGCSTFSFAVLTNWNSLEKLLKIDAYISVSSFTFIFYHR